MSCVSGERSVIAATREPATRASLTRDLERLDVRRGGVLVVHASVSALGWVCGGAEAVVWALLDALGPDGTLVAPTHTNANSEPNEWSAPAVPADWWPVIRAHTPPFDPAITPSRGMGALPELVRTWPGAMRSTHPHYSFAAVGAEAEAICARHPLDRGLGDGSPLARAEERDADVLLLGIGHGSNTSLHLAESRLPGLARAASGAAVRTPAGREWITWEDVAYDADDFAALGAAFEATAGARVGPVGVGAGRLMRQREVVAFGVQWLGAHRGRPSRAGNVTGNR